MSPESYERARNSKEGRLHLEDSLEFTAEFTATLSPKS
jgi:hypothetical protein